MNELMQLNYKLLSVFVFQNVLKNEAISTLMNVFAQSEISLSEAIVKYSKFLKILYESEFKGNFSLYLQNLIKYDDNIFSRACAKSQEIDENVKNAVKNELEIFAQLSQISTQKIKESLLNKFSGAQEIVGNLANFSNSEFVLNYDDLKENFQKNCFGIFAKYCAFVFDSNLKLLPVADVDKISLNDLKDYDTQKQKLYQNTKAFVLGKGANNVLLYGDRGCGKSSGVKAVFNEFKNKGLKIVQILKSNLANLDKLIELLSKIPAKFIIFIDDLSFNEESENLSTFKSVLEGALSAPKENILIYATTNRRHIVKETFSTREGNEVHLADTMDENASLSDRFGIILTYLSLNKDKYLEVARKIAQDKGIDIPCDFDVQAERFAILKSSRSPRVACQFVKSLQM